MRCLLRTTLSAVLLCAGACVHSSPPPPLRDVSLAGARASYRDYSASKAGICDAEPRWVAEELAGVNALLRRFLRSTEGVMRGNGSRSESEVLADGVGALPAVLKTHQRNLKAVARCDFASQSAVVDMMKVGAEVVRAARERLKAAPEVLAYLKAREERRAWRSRMVLERSEAQTRCRPKSQDIYFAFEGEDGITRVFFCDDAQVTLSSAGGTPDVSLPPSLAGKPKALRSRLEGLYLEKVKALRSSDVSLPPPLPPPPSWSASSAD